MRPHRSLTRPADFRRVARDGRRTRAAGLTIFAVPADETRVGLSVKATGAVARNRIKRRLRSAAAEGLTRPAEVVVKADERSLSVGFQELVRTFRWLSEAW